MDYNYDYFFVCFYTGYFEIIEYRNLYLRRINRIKKNYSFKLFEKKVFVGYYYNMADYIW